jgi:transcriptional regulator with XRE-family HTH domain
LSLTWSGTNEGGDCQALAGDTQPQQEKPETNGLKILKRAATIQPAEEQIAPADIAIPEQEEAVVDAAVETPVVAEEAKERVKLFTQSPVAEDAAVETEEPKKRVTLSAQAAPVEEVPVDDEEEKERVTLVAPTPAIADVPAVAELAEEGDGGDATSEQVLEDISATATLEVDGEEQEDPYIEEEITCSQMLRSGVTTVSEMSGADLDQEEGATSTIPAITPAEVNEEYTTEMEMTPEEQAPRKVLLSKPAEEQDANKPKPTVTVDKDDADMTSRLKVRKAPAIKTTNTCKMKPDTQEILSGASLGEKLRIAREASQMDLFEVAEKTRISSEYISALEEERFKELPLAAIYIKSYLKTLARCYGVDPDELIAEYEERTGADRVDEQQNNARNVAEETDQKRSDVGNARWISWAIGAVAAIVVIVLVAGVLVNRRIGNLGEEELSLVKDADLREMVQQEFLPYRERPIPLNETTALNR